MKIKIRSRKEITAPPKFDKTPKKTGDERKDHARKLSTTSYLVWFIVFVGIFIGVALTARIIFLFQKGTFVTSSYSVFVVNEDSYIVAFSKSSSKLAYISVPVDLDKNRLGKSLSLGVPIDGEINGKSGVLEKNKFPSIALIFSIIFRPWEFTYKNMTLIDSLNLVYRLLPINKGEIGNYKLSLSEEGELEGILSKTIYDIFKDPEIINEGMSVSIVNATGRNGLASAVGKIIGNIGGNVVELSSEKENNISEITASNNSTTLKRISRLLEIKPEMKENKGAISDIKIILGSDFLKRIKY
jgi:hypothetical protein